MRSCAPVASMLAAVAFAACFLAAQPSRALATGEPTPAAHAASTEPTASLSRPGSLLFLGNEKIAPVVYLDGTVPAGLAVDLVRALALHMSRPVEIRAMDWKQAQGLVADGKADALIQINATPERREIYDFSDPFLESHFAIFVRASQTGISGMSSLHGLRVGVESGGLPQQLLAKDSQIPLAVIPGFQEGFRMLNAGTIDAVVVDYRVGAYALATSRITNVKVAGGPIESSYSALAVRKGNAALLNEINNALRTIKADGTYQNILDDWAPTEGVFETQGQINERMFYAVIIALLVLLAIALTWAMTIRQQMNRKKAAEEALKVSQKKLALHLEQTLLGVIEWDTEFRVREWNPAAEAMFGYSREEAIGRHATELIVPESAREEVESVWQKLLHQEGGEFHRNENVTKDGRTILCEWVNTPLTDDGGNVVGVMGLARDITEHRRAEELRVAKEAAEAANVAKSAFLANMSHEIRTPMNAILGFSQLMRHDSELADRQRQQLDIINSSAEHLLALVNDVLEMSKVEAGRLSANRVAFDLHSLLGEMNSLFGLRAQAKGLELRVLTADDVPRFLVTDENKLRQVLVNLLGNAVKFTDEGSVELRVGTRRDEGGELRLEAAVQDTGCGIAPSDMDRLFRYFEQAAAGRAVQSGTGLGLAISREFVHLLGGEISATSELGVGSTFRFDVIVEEATGEVTVAGAEQRRVVGLCPGQPRYRVLVVDDAQDNRELLMQLLEPIGFAVREVSDGHEALREFEDWHPQLILMDMRMPVMDGYEATRRIRASVTGGDVAIIGVTASAFAEMRQGVFDAGVDEFIVKPFRESELFEKIATLLGVCYVYEELSEQAEPDVSDAPDAVAMAELPSDLQSRIRQAAVSADFDAVLELANEVASHDERLAAALRASAERFDAESILAALGQ
jgi:PAS domain S-box-containing protein